MMAYTTLDSVKARVSSTIPALRKRLLLLVTLSITALLTWILILHFRSREAHLPSILIPTGPRPSVTIPQGTYVGITVQVGPQPIDHFLGIPYGLSTGGERRFAAPLPINETSTETFSAADFGDVCPAGSPSVPQSEDCLNLNIYRPHDLPEDGRKLPVLVHVYGGSFNFGSSRDAGVAGMIAWSEAPFLGVTFNYRIGALGFLPSGVTERAGLLNAGLKDQLLVLEWVRANIEAFGGDPGDVTLMGQSAGAHAIGHLVLHNKDENPLFHKAIMESGGATARACYTPTNKMHEQQFRELLSILGCQNVPEDKIVKTLRGFSTVQIKHASEAIYTKYNPSIRWPWQPVIDGEGGVIPIRPIDSWRAGKWHKIPILTGFNTNEGAAFTPKNLATSKQFTDFFHTLLPGLTRDDLKTLGNLYPDPLTDPTSKYLDTRKGLNLGAEFKRAEQVYAQFAYIAPVKNTVEFAAKTSDKPAYLYHFAVNSSVIGGADHGSDGPYPRRSEHLQHISPTIRQISNEMHAYFTSFITTGDPNALKGKFGDRQIWPAYTAENGQSIVFGEDNDELAGGGHQGTAVKVGIDDWATEECRFWWERVEKFEL